MVQETRKSVNKYLASATDLLTGLGRLARFRLEKKSQNLSIGVFVERAASQWPNGVMVVSKHQQMTWSQFNSYANRFAHSLKEQGVMAGDSVALLMENEPEMLAALVGVCKLGATAGLINHNLRGKSLVHCISALDCRTVLFSSAGAEAMEELSDDLRDCELHYVATASGQEKPVGNWLTALRMSTEYQASSNLPDTQRVSFSAPAYYIFTSGTTGLPKAAIVTHYHWYRASAAFARLLLGLKPGDRMYVCLPIFHTAAMLCGFGASTLAGSSFYLAQKFSANSFWDEVRASNSNIFLYIGELCRYLLNSPPQPSDGDNPLTTCVGNGLQPELWTAFQQRFSIPKIAEYYGSTEGNLAFMNIFNRERTFGMGLGRFRVVKYVQERDEIIRDSKGFCVPVGMGEVGLLLTEISAKSPFAGYTDSAATNAKILKNVFSAGDMYVNTGDLIKRTDVGFTVGIPHYQFYDRVGDTFRWKGENVSTGEIAEIMNSIPGVLQSSVYGVLVPATEGRAGMAALVVDRQEFSLAHLAQHLAENVPAYARPVFIRIENSLQTTDTFKIQKTGLIEEAYDIRLVEAPIWVMKPRTEQYVPLDLEFLQLIEAGRAGY